MSSSIESTGKLLSVYLESADRIYLENTPESYDLAKIIYEHAASVALEHEGLAREYARARGGEGNCCECTGLFGSAVECWSDALGTYEKIGLGRSFNATRLREILACYERLPTAFLSYAHADGSFARRLVENLNLRRCLVFFDETSFRAGTRIESDIRRNIARSENLLFAWSPAYRDSAWCDLELELFLQAVSVEPEIPGRRVIPILLRKEPALPAAWRDVLAVDAMDESESAVFDRIWHALSGGGRTDPVALRPGITETAYIRPFV